MSLKTETVRDKRRSWSLKGAKKSKDVKDVEEKDKDKDKEKHKEKDKEKDKEKEKEKKGGSKLFFRSASKEKVRDSAKDKDSKKAKGKDKNSPSKDSPLVHSHIKCLSSNDIFLIQSNVPSDEWRDFIQQVNASLQGMGAAEITEEEFQMLLKQRGQLPESKFTVMYFISKQ